MLRLLLLLSLWCISTSQAQESDRVIRLTSLYWPPYSGQELPEQGFNIFTVRQAMEKVGFRLEVHFYPWSRAVKLGTAGDSSYEGYLPEYYDKALAKKVVFSDPIGKGPLGLAENRYHPIIWTHLDDLKKYRLGVVQDYVNTIEIDKRIAAGELHAFPAISDAQNLKKLAHHRIDLAIVDVNVFYFLTQNDPEVIRLQKTIQMQPKVLVNKNLYVVFKRTAKGEALAKELNKGLKLLNDEYE